MSDTYASKCPIMSIGSMLHTFQPSNVHIQQSQVIHQQIIQPMTDKKHK